MPFLPLRDVLKRLASRHDREHVELIARLGARLGPRRPINLIFAEPELLANLELHGAFKLLFVAGAYWKGDQSRKQLQRLYGTAFFSKQDLREHLERIEEIAELPTGAVRGLGARLLAGSYYGQTIQIWSALITAAVLAASLVMVVGLVEKFTLKQMGMER